MATKLVLRNTAANGIGNYFDMPANSFGSSADTGVVNTTASGTQIQWTRTAGGTVLEFISGRVPAGGFTLSGTMTFSIWAHESNMNTNCGARARVFKRASGGSETEIGGGPWDDGVEFGTAAAEMTWTGTPTSTAFSENDRIVVRFYITNIGTMASGHTCTLTYNAADATTGDSFFQINENVTFKAEDVIGSGDGSASGSGAASGTGVAVANSTGLASGAGSASASGGAVNTGAADASGSGAASGAGAYLLSCSGSSEGAGSADGVGALTHAATAASSGSATADASGQSTAQATAQSNGTSSVGATGIGVALSVGNGSGSATTSADGAAMVGGVAFASGGSTVVGQSDNGGPSAADGQSFGSSNVTAQGVSIASSVAVSAGVSVCSGVATPLISASFISSSSAGANAIGSWLHSAAAQTSGSATASGDGFAVSASGSEMRVLRIDASPALGADIHVI